MKKKSILISFFVFFILISNSYVYALTPRKASTPREAFEKGNWVACDPYPETNNMKLIIIGAIIVIAIFALLIGIGLYRKKKRKKTKKDEVEHNNDNDM